MSHGTVAAEEKAVCDGTVRTDSRTKLMILAVLKKKGFHISVTDT
jgi:hypothetical protein